MHPEISMPVIESALGNIENPGKRHIEKGKLLLQSNIKVEKAIPKQFNANEIDPEVVWKSGAKLNSLAGETVRIEFTMRNTRILAFHFPKTENP